MSDMDMKNQIKELDESMKKIDELSDEKVEREECEVTTDCPPIPTCLKIPFCCVTTMPRGFDMHISTGDFKKWLVYDVSCLHCCSEPCNIPITIHCCNGDEDDSMPGYSVKIVGCIKYMAAAFPVKGAGETTLCGGQFNPEGDTVIDNAGKGIVCCQGCECVDKVIGCISCEGTCECECPDINCNTVTVENFQVEELNYTMCSRDQRPVKFTGKFVIPGCQ